MLVRGRFLTSRKVLCWFQPEMPCDVRIRGRFLTSPRVFAMIQPEMPPEVRIRGRFLTSPRVFAMIRPEMPRDVRIRGYFLISQGRGALQERMPGSVPGMRGGRRSWARYKLPNGVHQRPDLHPAYGGAADGIGRQGPVAAARPLFKFRKHGLFMLQRTVPACET